MIKAMILAAGRGERMRPLTDSCPKPLLQVNGLALIEYHLISLNKLGIQEFIINHAWLGEQIENFLGNGDKYGVVITYSKEQQPLDTAGGIIKALPLLVSDGDSEKVFIVVNGDVFTDYDFSNLLKIKNKLKQASAHLVMIDNPAHHPSGDFYLSKDGLLDQNNSEQVISKYTFSGIGIYHAGLFSDLDEGKRALAPLLRLAMAKQRVTGEYYQGMWADVGTPERLKQLNNKVS